MKTRVLFVCMGNICRSPAAEGVLQKLAKDNGLSDELEIASCGLGSWYVGHQADARMRSAAQLRGVSLVNRARQLDLNDYDAYDYLFAADNEVLLELQRHATTTEHKAKIHLFTEYSPSFKGREVPDPYYNGQGAFEEVLDIIEDACEGFIQHLRKEKKLS